MIKFIILSIVCFLVAGTLSAKSVASHYENIGRSEGLSNNTVSAIISDRHGYVWVGTLNGLNRYNGTSFKIFERTIGESNSLSGNEIKSLFTDSLGNMWVGTATGLSLYDAKTETFRRFQHSILDSTSLSNNNISRITGSGTNIWVATSNGLNKINILTKEIERLYPTRLGGASDEIQDIAENEKSGLWIGCFGKGIDYLDYKKANISHFGTNAPRERYIQHNNISTVLSVGSGTILAGYNNGVLLRIHIEETQQPTIETIEYGLSKSKIISLAKGNGKIIVSTDQYGLSFLEEDGLARGAVQVDNSPMVNNKIWCAHESRDNILWVGHYRGGMTKIDQHYSSRIESFRIDSANPYAQIVSSVIGSEDGNIWVGTDGGGAYWFDKNIDEASRRTIATLRNKAVLCIAQATGYMWFGTYSSGLIRCDTKGKCTYYLPDAMHPERGPSGKDIRDILVQDSILWFCDHGNYLNKLNVATGVFSHYVLNFTHPELGAVFPSPWCINAIDSNKLAIGTNRGLVIFDTQTFQSSNITERTDSKDGLSSPMVRTLYRYSDDTLLIGTEHGMDILSIKSMHISHLHDRLLPNNYICGITADAQRNLWVTTKTGIVKIDPLLSNAQWLDKSDGIMTNDFIENSIFCSKNGKIYCGSAMGLAVIDSRSLQVNSEQPKLVFDELFLNHNRVAIADSSPLKQSLNWTNNILLPYWYKTIGFSFSSLSFIQHHKNRYSCKLEGFDHEWSPYSSNTSVTYSNLNPGRYILLVKTKNNDGYESEPRRLIIDIAPPYYKTLWFYLLSGILSIATLFWFYTYRVSRIRVKNEFLKHHNYLLSKEIVERKNAEKNLIKAKEIAESANRAKTEFLANMSHEIRTPLNAVQGFCEVISQTSLTPIQQKYINSISIASDSLLTLINDLLDLSKIEAGQLEIHNAPLHIASLAGDIEQMFEYMVRKKDLKFTLLIDDKVPPNVLLDISRLRQILVNLMGNAIKFTNKGYVRMHISAESYSDGTATLRFDVEDTGIGIHKKYTDKVFDAFSQAESSSVRRYEGTGLGLAICKKMAELMGGSIELESTISVGSIFSLILPDITVTSSAELTKKDIERLTAKSERTTAIIISPDIDYIDQLTDTLTNISVGAEVFAADDLEYLLSLPTQNVLIMVFNPTEEELYADRTYQIVIINTKGNDYSTYKQHNISPPFDTGQLKAILRLGDDSETATDSAAGSLNTGDAGFLTEWLADYEILSEVMDLDTIAEAAEKLAQAGLLRKSQLFTDSATSLLEAVEAFDLLGIESVITKLKYTSTHD